MGATTYVYDGEGRRIEKTSSTFTSFYVYDASGDQVAEYTTETQPNYGTFYITADHLGSTRLLTMGDGTVVRRFDYLPFGEEIPAGSYSRGADYGGNRYPNAGGAGYPGDAASHKFTGKERDWETGLDYFGARYLSGSQGRFTSADAPFADQRTADPQSWNMYGYVRNNPLGNKNPNGKGACGVNVSSCADYIAGGLKAIANIPSDLDSALNRAVNFVISPFTSYQFPDAPSFQGANADERQGMEAASAVMLVSPAAELGAAKIAGALGASSAVEAGAAVAAETGTVYKLPAQEGRLPSIHRAHHQIGRGENGNSDRWSDGPCDERRFVQRTRPSTRSI